MSQFLDMSFWRDFVSNALATSLGVLIGIPVALWIDRLISQQREKQEQKARQDAERERRLQLLRLLRETLEKNRGLIERMTSELTPDSVITYNVDTSLLESTASLKYEIIDHLDLNRRLDALRYELQHLHRKVELQLEVEFSSTSAITRSHYRVRLVDTIRDTLPTIINEINEVMALIDAELTR